MGKILKGKGVSVSNLLKIIGSSLIEDLVKELEADKWVIKLKTGTLFQLILYSLLDSERISLRVMSENYSSPVFKAMEETIVGDIAHNTIQQRLIKVDVRFFKKIYSKTQEILVKNFDDKYLSRYNLKRYDSTMIAVFSHLMEGMKVGNTSKNKGQVKVTTELVNDFSVRFSFFKEQSHLSEETALKEVIEQVTHHKKDLIVFDRGIKSRKTFKSLKDKGTQFVTRLNTNARYEFIKSNSEVSSIQDDQLNFVQDSIVHLYQTGKKELKEEFRLIEVSRKEDGKVLYFLTNIIDLPAEMIAVIYKQRWQIEVFFRFLKQEMNLTHFVCNDTNAIQVMLYCTMIAAMLVLIYKKQNKIKSYKIAKIRFFKELEATVMLDLIDAPDGVNRLRYILKKHIHKKQ